jgi:NADH-quinone oxidoreductase subunit M
MLEGLYKAVFEGRLLSIAVFAPTVGALLTMLLVPKHQTRVVKWVALFFTGISLLASIVLFDQFKRGQAGMQMVERWTWIKQLNIEYYLAVDGISVTMIILTGLLSFICIIASWNIEEWKVNKGIKGYFILFQLLSTGMMGVFCAMDFFLFYVFWEIVLLPMYFLVGIWGGPRREYAAIKFFLYTLAGSVLMLIVMLAVYFTSQRVPVPGDVWKDTAGNGHTFDLVYLATQGKLLTGMWWKLAFLGLFVAFAIKVPVVPFHTWLPDAHVEAPTPISVILAGVLLKMGTYGFLRISFPLLPEATYWFSPIMMLFGVVSIIYGAMCSMAQIRGVPRINSKTGERFLERDWKKLVAYSSVSHMGYCMMGMAAATPAGLTGAVFTMWSHGIVSASLFLLVGVVYDRAHHRDIGEFGGLWSQMPYYGGITGLMFMASLGLPGLSGFIGEALCFIGAFQVSDAGAVYAFGAHGEHYWKIMTSISVLGVVLGAAYALWSYQKVFLGPLNERYRGITDMNWREGVCLVPLAILAILFGIYPAGLIDMMNDSLANLSQTIGMPWVRALGK